MSTQENGSARSDVLLVGSLPYDTAEEALRAAGKGLKGHVAWLPDGEVGAAHQLGRDAPARSCSRRTTRSSRRWRRRSTSWSSPSTDAGAAGRGSRRHLELADQAGRDGDVRRPRLRALRPGVLRGLQAPEGRGRGAAGRALPALAARAAQRDRRLLRRPHPVARALRRLPRGHPRRDRQGARDHPRRRPRDPVGRRLGVRRHGDGRPQLLQVLAQAHARRRSSSATPSSSTTSGRASRTRRSSASTGATAPGAAGP